MPVNQRQPSDMCDGRRWWHACAACKTVRFRVCLFSVLLSCSITLAPHAWPRVQCFMSKPWGSFHWVLLVLVFQ